jgi:hydroxymethylbilane synthase
MPSLPPIRIGTRKSTLALAQAEILRQSLLAAFPGLAVELVPMLTTGDRNTDRALAHIDLAVHSLKDMETRLPQGLVIASVLPRDDPRDALVAKDARSFASLPRGARVGTSSPRRTAQLAIARPDLTIVPFRGNVTTRLSKIKGGEVDATLLALAGLKRIGLEREAAEILDTERFIPAAGQGIIAVECREDNAAARGMLETIRHAPTHSVMLAERGVLAAIDGSCRTPIAAYAQIADGRLVLHAMAARPDGSAHARTTREGPPSDAAAMGKDAGNELLARGAKDWLS